MDCLFSILFHHLILYTLQFFFFANVFCIQYTEYIKLILSHFIPLCNQFLFVIGTFFFTVILAYLVNNYKRFIYIYLWYKKKTFRYQKVFCYLIRIVRDADASCLDPTRSPVRYARKQVRHHTGCTLRPSQGMLRGRREAGVLRCIHVPDLCR